MSSYYPRDKPCNWLHGAPEGSRASDDLGPCLSQAVSAPNLEYEASAYSITDHRQQIASAGGVLLMPKMCKSRSAELLDTTATPYAQ